MSYWDEGYLQPPDLFAPDIPDQCPDCEAQLQHLDEHGCCPECGQPVEPGWEPPDEPPGGW